MPHEVPQINGLSLEQILAVLAFPSSGKFVHDPSFASNALTVLNQIARDTVGFTGSFENTFLVHYDEFHPLPTTWDGFLTAIENNYGIVSTSQIDAITQAFVMDYRNLLYINNNIGAGGSDWADLLSTPSIATDASITQQFKNSFTEFLEHYPYETTNLHPTGDLLAKWVFSTPITALLRNSTLGQVNQTTQATNTTHVVSYETIYNSLFPGGDFATRLREFYGEQLNKTSNGGVFSPSISLQDWTSELLQDFLKTRAPNGVVGGFVSTSVTTSASRKPLVLDRIFLLLVEMISSLQNAAAAQASRLTFLTQWQKVYTDIQAQFHTFTRRDGTSLAETNARPFDDTDEGKAQKQQLSTDRGDMNSLNASLKDLIQAFRGQVSDDAKALQSNVNQSNDAVNQQANMATSIIQQFSTILAAIYR